MKEVEDVYRYHEKLNDFFRDNDVDGCIYQPDCTVAILKLLHNLFGEKDKDEWISYFCFELDFGAKYKDGVVKDADGAPIKLSTYEDLYNILVG